MQFCKSSLSLYVYDVFRETTVWLDVMTHLKFKEVFFSTRCGPSELNEWLFEGDWCGCKYVIGTHLHIFILVILLDVRKWSAWVRLWLRLDDGTVAFIYWVFIFWHCSDWVWSIHSATVANYTALRFYRKSNLKYTHHPECSHNDFHVSKLIGSWSHF